MENLFYYFGAGVLGIIIGYNMPKRKGRKKTHLIFTTIINKFKIKIMALSLNKQEFVNTQLALVDANQNPVSATFTDIVLTSSDESIFTSNTDVNNDQLVDVLGVSVGEASLSVAAKATYTNSNGQEVTEDKAATVAVTVTLPPPGQTELVVTFTAPQPA